MEVGKSQIRGLIDLVTGENLFPKSLCPHMVERGRELYGSAEFSTTAYLYLSVVIKNSNILPIVFILLSANGLP